MPNIWFTSDTHFGHSNIIKFSHRPFLNEVDRLALEAAGGKWHTGTWKGPHASGHKISAESTAMMDQALIDGINAVVAPSDTLYHLGDFHMSHKSQVVLKAQEYRQRIHCRNVHLIWGNHDNRDAVSPLNKLRTMGDLFSSAQDLLKIKIGAQEIILCHYAMAVWNRSHRGSWHLYGHSHGNAEATLDSLLGGRRSMDVGVDNAKLLLGEYRPFSFEEIRDILQDRPGSVIDHHLIAETHGTPEE